MEEIRSCRISSSIPARITEPPEKREAAKEWANTVKDLNLPKMVLDRHYDSLFVFIGLTSLGLGVSVLFHNDKYW